MKNLDRLKSFKLKKDYTYTGRVTKIVGMTIEADGPMLGIGSMCVINTNTVVGEVSAEIVGFKDDRVILMPYGESDGICPGSVVRGISDTITLNMSNTLLGRILDGLGRPIDGLGPLDEGEKRSIYSSAPNPMQRRTIKDIVSTGVKAIDGLVTIGSGQRVGIFAGSGVGKSVLLGMISQNTSADVNVIALIGERGREVREFIERDLGEEGLKRSVVVVVTSDQAALIRRMGAFLATSIAEYFRDQGHEVMFMMDSITRFAMAQREIGLAVGEPPASKGYTPSVFTLLPKLLERAGTIAGEGSITGLYTVLVEGDDMNDPIADSVRSIIDGHIVLDRSLAAKNHFPAIDVLMSASRLMKEITSEVEQDRAGRFRDLLATYKEAEDLINIGAYVQGNNPKIDEAVRKIDAINNLLRQKMSEKFTYEETANAIAYIVESK